MAKTLKVHYTEPGMVWKGYFTLCGFWPLKRQKDKSKVTCKACLKVLANPPAWMR